MANLFNRPNLQGAPDGNQRPGFSLGSWVIYILVSAVGFLYMQNLSQSQFMQKQMDKNNKACTNALQEKDNIIRMKDSVILEKDREINNLHDDKYNSVLDALDIKVEKTKTIVSKSKKKK